MKSSKKSREYLFIAIPLLILLCAADSFYGNPVSRLWARHTAQQYLSTHYADTDFYIEDMDYSSGIKGYVVDIASPTSIDSHFELRVKKFAPTTVYSDTYERLVPTGLNTAWRVNRIYQDLVYPVIEAEDAPYTLLSLYSAVVDADSESGDQSSIYPYVLAREDLVMDGDYDALGMAPTTGKLEVRLQEENPTPELAAEMLLEIRRRMDEAGVPFYCIDLALVDSESYEECIDIENFLYEDIYPEGLIARISAADKKTACD